MIKVYDAPLANVKYAYVETLKQCKKLYKQLDIPFDKLPTAPCAAHTQTLVNKREEDGRTITDVMCIVWLKPTRYIGMDVPLLVHEAVHIKQELLFGCKRTHFHRKLKLILCRVLQKICFESIMFFTVVNSPVSFLL